jgi:adenine phosphoribosyltransferase
MNTPQTPPPLAHPPNASAYIRSHIRTVPDWPAAGVMFRDITPLLSSPRVFRVLIDEFVHRYFDERPAAIAGLDARGFIIGSVLAYELNVGFVPIRKKGKLPFRPWPRATNSNTAARRWRCTPTPCAPATAWC